jgi:hypothetical protein
MTRTEIACVITMCAAMLAGLAVFVYDVHAGRESRELTRQHRDCTAEQGLRADQCCRVGRAWVCPLAMKESNDE